MAQNPLRLQVKREMLSGRWAHSIATPARWKSARSAARPLEPSCNPFQQLPKKIRFVLTASPGDGILAEVQVVIGSGLYVVQQLASAQRRKDGCAMSELKRRGKGRGRTVRIAVSNRYSPGFARGLAAHHCLQRGSRHLPACPHYNQEKGRRSTSRMLS